MAKPDSNNASKRGATSCGEIKTSIDSRANECRASAGTLDRASQRVVTIGEPCVRIDEIPLCEDLTIWPEDHRRALAMHPIVKVVAPRRRP